MGMSGLDSHREARSSIQAHDCVQATDDHALIRFRAIDMVQQRNGRHKVGVACGT